MTSPGPAGWEKVTLLLGETRAGQQTFPQIQHPTEPLGSDRSQKKGCGWSTRWWKTRAKEGSHSGKPSLIQVHKKVLCLNCWDFGDQKEPRPLLRVHKTTSSLSRFQLHHIPSPSMVQVIRCPVLQWSKACGRTHTHARMIRLMWRNTRIEGTVERRTQKCNWLGLFTQKEKDSES